MARGHQMQPVVLSEEERERLGSLARRRTSAQRSRCGPGHPGPPPRVRQPEAAAECRSDAALQPVQVAQRFRPRPTSRLDLPSAVARMIRDRNAIAWALVRRRSQTAKALSLLLAQDTG